MPRKIKNTLPKGASDEEVRSRIEKRQAIKDEEGKNGTYLLLCTIRDECPHTWMVYEYPYAQRFSSIEEGLEFVRNENEEEEGMWPEGSYLFMYGLWPGAVVGKLQDALELASWPYI